jgi:multimeric flavodoxin WrbA
LYVEADGVVLGLVGSPNRDGRTFQMVVAALEAAAAVGATVELVQMADHIVAPCQDCEPWTCMTDLRCRYSDPGFEYLADKLLTCGALVLGTPIYWWDTSALVRYLILKMFRVYAR